jgi:hypothetical protein
MAPNEHIDARERLLLLCGVLSSLFYVAMNVVVPMQWKGYSCFSQVVSELSAIGAPTRTLWIALSVPYDLLLIGFGWGIWRSARGSRSLRIVALAMLIDGVLSLAWPPMHLREALAAGGGTLSDTLHNAFTMVWAALALLAMGFAATALGMRFRFYSIVTMIVLVGFGALTGLYGPDISANLPTPWVGVWERVNIGAYMLWVVVLAGALLREHTTMHVAAPRVDATAFGT